MKAKTCLLIFLFLFPCTMLQIVGAEPKPKVYVDPTDNTFSTDTASVGTEFTIAIKAADFTVNVYSYEMKLAYDNTTLEALEATIPTDHWLKPAKASNIFIVDSGTINQNAGVVSFALSLLGDEQGGNGSGTFNTIKFKITQAPTASLNLTSVLELKDVILVDVNTTPITQDQYDIVNGNFLFFAPALPPGPKPKIAVDPKDNNFTSATSIGHNFTVSIKAVNFTAPGVYSYEMKLRYNNSVLEAVAAELPTGHWLTPAKASNIFVVDGGTINQTEAFVSFAATLLGEEAGKTGDGTIATVTFMMTLAPPENGSLSSVLELEGVLLVDPTTTQIPSDQYDTVNGNYFYSAAAGSEMKEDLNGDGNVNIEDVAIWGLAFGSTSENPRWNSLADMNGDGKVDMIDGVLICKAWSS